MISIEIKIEYTNAKLTLTLILTTLYIIVSVA